MTLEELEYSSILEVFASLIENKQRHYTLKGSRRKRPWDKERSDSSLLGSAAKLKFILLYLRSNPNQTVYGYHTGRSQAKVSEWVSFLLPVLEQSMDRLGYSPKYGLEYTHQSSEEAYLAADVVERQVPKRSCQKA